MDCEWAGESCCVCRGRGGHRDAKSSPPSLCRLTLIYVVERTCSRATARSEEAQASCDTLRSSVPTHRQHALAAPPAASRATCATRSSSTSTTAPCARCWPNGATPAAPNLFPTLFRPLLRAQVRRGRKRLLVCKTPTPASLRTTSDRSSRAPAKHNLSVCSRRRASRRSC